MKRCSRQYQQQQQEQQEQPSEPAPVRTSSSTSITSSSKTPVAAEPNSNHPKHNESATTKIKTLC
jgi:hypothetical protein